MRGGTTKQWRMEGGRTTRMQRARPTIVDQFEHFGIIDDVAELESSEERDNEGGVKIAKVSLDL